MNDEFRQRRRVPVVTTGAPLLGLVVNAVPAAFFPLRKAWIVRTAGGGGDGRDRAMDLHGDQGAAEIREQPPLVRLFPVVGFVWMAILFGITLLDYAAR